MSDSTWLQTGPMADELGISVRTIHHYRSSDQSPWQEGRHYKRRTPADKSAWIWD
ncbi:excisionase family protein [Synechococcus sp. AH-601-B19]|nr:excisionase family protein [Synechococcus sp. AH-601-B19]